MKTRKTGHAIQSLAPMGANLGGVYLPKYFGCIPPNIFMPHISELDDLFFGLHYILGKKLGNYDLFFVLHNVLSERLVIEMMTFVFVHRFIALHCGGQKFGQPRGDVKFAKSSPPISKNGKKWSLLQNHPPNAQHRFAPLLGPAVLNFLTASLEDQTQLSETGCQTFGVSW